MFNIFHKTFKNNNGCYKYKIKKNNKEIKIKRNIFRNTNI